MAGFTCAAALRGDFRLRDLIRRNLFPVNRA